MAMAMIIGTAVLMILSVSVAGTVLYRAYTVIGEKGLHGLTTELWQGTNTNNTNN